MMELKGKKLLILGGSYQHRKIVRKARELGIETFLTDYLPLEKSPAKQMADHQYMLNITDVDELVELCRKERIDGIVAPYLDVTQKPYQQICEIMGYPCFGNAWQHGILTDKPSFKKFCEEHGADVIPGYTEGQIYDGTVEYPILIKPSDSRGSRGQSICYSRSEAEQALSFAKKESSNGEVIIEKYMHGAHDLQLAYLVINGEPLLYKVEDRYEGTVEDGLDKIAIACVSPSKYETAYRQKADSKVVKMIKALGLVNAPVFIQAFFDGETARLYDPGLRMPGDDYDDGHRLLTGIDIPELLIRFALTGEMSNEVARKIRDTRLNGYCAMILPCLREGIISKIIGIEKIEINPHIVAWSHAYEEGDEVHIEKTVKQRYGEFVITAANKDELKREIKWLFDTLHVYDENGEDMLIAKFDENLLDEYAQ